MVQKGKPVVVVFFGEHPVRGTVEDVDKANAQIAFGQGAWKVTAPRDWIQEQEDELLLALG